MGDCPAAVAVDESGNTVFVTNREAFPRLSRQEQYFILAHELGHRLLGTGDELVADAFALGLTAGRQHKSLRSALSAVAKMDAVPVSRVRQLYRLCMEQDIKHKKI